MKDLCELRGVQPTIARMDIDTTALKEDLKRVLGWENVSLFQLAGSTSAVLYLAKTADAEGVVRIFDAQRWEEDTADLSNRETVVLEALLASKLATPEPMATLPGNGVVMSFLPGAVNLPTEPDSTWLTQLAVALTEIHASEITVPYHYESWNNFEPDTSPSWWTDAVQWNRAQALHKQKVSAPVVFIHRDYHPLNLLWQGNRVCGVVDWINGCMGPAHVDISHCRLNLALMYGMQAADGFRDAYQQLNPRWLYQPYWDLDAAFGAMPNPKVYPPWETFGLTGLNEQIIRERLIALVESVVSNQD